MKLSLREVCQKATQAYSKIPRGEWVLQWPGQIVLAASQIHWTSEVTQVMNVQILTKFTRFVNIDEIWQILTKCM